jgi:hypothetical protein
MSAPADTTGGSSRAWGALFIVACAAFLALWLMHVHQTLTAVPAAVGWFAALMTLRPLVARDRLPFLYCAFGIIAFLIFFLHETYEYHGKIRTFPLIVGWTGIILSILDILGLTETRVARAINTFFGAHHQPSLGDAAIGREAACIVAMAAGVVLIWLVGFLIASPLFVFLWMWRWGGKPVRTSLYGAVFTFAFIWILFEVLLSYELFRGEVVLWIVDQLQS